MNDGPVAQKTELREAQERVLGELKRLSLVVEDISQLTMPVRKTRPPMKACEASGPKKDEPRAPMWSEFEAMRIALSNMNDALEQIRLEIDL